MSLHWADGEGTASRPMSSPFAAAAVAVCRRGRAIRLPRAECIAGDATSIGNRPAHTNRPNNALFTVTCALPLGRTVTPGVPTSRSSLWLRLSTLDSRELSPSCLCGTAPHTSADLFNHIFSHSTPDLSHLSGRAGQVSARFPPIVSMSSDHGELSMSQLSLNSSDTEDWDRSMSSDLDPNSTKTPRNSVSFPGNGGADEDSGSRDDPLGRGAGKRTLSELLKLHAEKGTDVNFTPEEASRVAEVLGQWVSRANIEPIV